MTAAEEYLGLTVVTDKALKLAAQNAGCLYKVGKRYYIDRNDIREIKKSCRVQPKAPASTDLKVGRTGTSETLAESKSRQALEAVKKLKAHSPDTSKPKRTQVVQLSQKRST
jgi:hypothetical protein